jgi:glycosyltransferase involved in cell wall biosynthesis
VRLAIITQSRDRVGGVEAYLESVIAALARRHEVLFWSASGEGTGRGAVRLPPGLVALAADGASGDPVHHLRDWRPDLLFAHGLDDAALESEVLRLAPAVIVEHTYHGTCISSSKTMSWPGVQPCQRPLGAACLALYLPRRCGGLNPVTMVQAYRTQRRRLAELRKAAAVVTFSAHMAAEVLRNGVRHDRIHVVPPFVTADQSSPDVGSWKLEVGSSKLEVGSWKLEVGSSKLDVGSWKLEVGSSKLEVGSSKLAVGSWKLEVGSSVVRLLFLGRLEPLKGVSRLLAALRPFADRLAGPVRLVIAGEGSERHKLEAQAARIRAESGSIEIVFAGWQDEPGRARLFAETDLLVVPSLWPEPFGLVGLEAAAAGVPAAAFATGGITEWLRDGENGCLARAAGAEPEDLADAMARCVATPETRARLSEGARRLAREWTLDRHMAAIERVFASALHSLPAGIAS